MLILWTLKAVVWQARLAPLSDLTSARSSSVRTSNYMSSTVESQIAQLPTASMSSSEGYDAHVLQAVTVTAEVVCEKEHDNESSTPVPVTANSSPSTWRSLLIISLCLVRPVSSLWRIEYLHMLPTLSICHGRTTLYEE